MQMVFRLAYFEMISHAEIFYDGPYLTARDHVIEKFHMQNSPCIATTSPISVKRDYDVIIKTSGLLKRFSSWRESENMQKCHYNYSDIKYILPIDPSALIRIEFVLGMRGSQGKVRKNLCESSLEKAVDFRVAPFRLSSPHKSFYLNLSQIHVQHGFISEGSI